MRRIPDGYRRFTESRARAARLYRIPDDLLERFLDLGLPHERGGSGDGLLFDRNDLNNIVLALRLSSPQHTALRAMSTALQEGQVAARLRRTVNIQARCGDPGHEGRCAFELNGLVNRSPDVSRVTVRADRNFEVEVTLAGGAARHLDTPPVWWRLMEQVAGLEYYHIPHDLNADLGFLAESGLANCRLATHFLIAKGREFGLEIRGVTGLFLSRPFSNRHYWTEIRQDDEWVAADPFFLMVLAHWGVLDARSWPPNRVPLGALWRLDLDFDDPVVTHKGGSETSYVTR